MISHTHAHTVTVSGDRVEIHPLPPGSRCHDLTAYISTVHQYSYSSLLLSAEMMMMTFTVLKYVHVVALQYE